MCCRLVLCLYSTSACTVQYNCLYGTSTDHVTEILNLPPLAVVRCCPDLGTYSEPTEVSVHLFTQGRRKRLTFVLLILDVIHIQYEKASM